MQDLSDDSENLLDHGGEFEELAYKTSINSDFSTTLEHVIEQLKPSSSTPIERQRRCVAFLAWLLCYESVDPLLVLEAMLVINDFESVRICGTQDFESDVLDHLNITPVKRSRRKYGSPGKRPRIFLDILSSDTKTPARDDNIVVQRPIKEKPSKEVENEIMLTTRRIILGSMSAPEAAKKSQLNFVRDSEYIIYGEIMQVAYENKLYSRSSGNITIQLLASHEQRWALAFMDTVRFFFVETVQDIQEVYKLKVAGQYLGHILSTKLEMWPEFFPLLQSDSSANDRIVILSLLGELKASMGTTAVEKTLLELDNIEGLTEPESAADFWELAGFYGVAQVINDRAEHDKVDRDN